MDQKRDPFAAEYFCGFPGTVSRIVGNTNIEGLPLTNRLDQGSYTFFQWSLRIGSVMIKNIDIFQSQTFQAVVQAGKKILPGTKIPIWPGPHGEPRFCGDDELISVGF
jgi:hypothetical protein